MTQGEKVIQYLEEHEFLTRRTAMNKLYINNLPDVVRRLRLKGIKIETVDEKTKNSKYGKYRLIRNEETDY